MQIIKYTFDVPVVAIVSYIPAKSRMAVNYVRLRLAPFSTRANPLAGLNDGLWPIS